MKNIIPTMSYILIFSSAIFLGLLHYYSEWIITRLAKYSDRLISLSAGVAISYVILVLLPEVYQGIKYIENFVFMVILAGVALAHVVEKFVYQHAGSKAARRKELGVVHAVTFFVYHFILGIVIFKMFQTNITEALLLFIPVALHSTFSEISFVSLHKKEAPSLFRRLLLSGSVLFGCVIAMIFTIGDQMYFVLLALLAGLMLFLVIRDTFPPNKQGEPAYFSLGVILYSLLIFIIWEIKK